MLDCMDRFWFGATHLLVNTQKHTPERTLELVQSYICVVEMVIVSHDGNDDDMISSPNMDQSVVIQCN